MRSSVRRMQVSFTPLVRGATSRASSSSPPCPWPRRELKRISFNRRGLAVAPARANAADVLAPGIKSGSAVADATSLKPLDELFIYESGSGDEAVIFLHGLAETHRYWLSLIPHLNEKKYRYLIPDLLGHGRSPKPLDEGYNVDSHIRYLVRDIFEGWSRAGAAPIKRVKGPARVIGHGVGAVLALEVASRFPDRISQLILIGLPYFHDKHAAWSAFQIPLDFISFYNYVACFATVYFFRYTRYLTASLVARVTDKPRLLLLDSMKHARAHALYRTYLYCVVFHRLDGAARNIRDLSKIPLHLIHPNSNDANVPLSSAHSFFNKYSDFTELAVFSEKGDLALHHSQKLAEHLTKIFMEQ